MSNDLIGKKIERYYLVKKLGEGVIAVTYEALDSTLDRRVAIKVVQPDKEHLSAFHALANEPFDRLLNLPSGGLMVDE